MLSNEEIINSLLLISGCDNHNQLAKYLTKKYGVNISRQSVQNFSKADSATTITAILLREALEKY